MSKKNGRSIIIKGRTGHSKCKDGNLCPFQGFIFENGNTTYAVIAQGNRPTLRVTRNKSEVLLGVKGQRKD